MAEETRQKLVKANVTITEDRHVTLGGVDFDLSHRGAAPVLAQVDDLSETDTRLAYRELTKDGTPRDLEAEQAVVKLALQGAHRVAWGKEFPESVTSQLSEAVKEAQGTVAGKNARDPIRKTRIDDVLRLGVKNGKDRDGLYQDVQGFLAGVESEDLNIKDVIITGILEGLETDDIVTLVHETFADHPTIEPRTGPKDVAYYRTRLRQDFNIELPYAFRRAEEPAEGDGAEAPASETETAEEATEAAEQPAKGTVKTRAQRAKAARKTTG